MFDRYLIIESLILLTGIFVFIFIYRNGFNLISRIKNKILKNVVNTCFLLLFIFTIIISTKLVAFDIYRIPSVSMENTLFPEDIILVDKLKYGARLPRSPFEIPWVNLVFYFNDTAKKRIKENWWGYKRIIGLEKIKQGDVFVFNSVSSKNNILVKRCVALAGDTLHIINAKIITNNELFSSYDSEKNNYKFKITNKKKIYNIIDSLALKNYISIDNKINYGEANLQRLN
jgi:signal peptidase I